MYNFLSNSIPYKTKTRELCAKKSIDGNLFDSISSCHLKLIPMASVFVDVFLQSKVSGHKFSDKLWNMLQRSGLRLDWPRVIYGNVWSFSFS